jgi:hypothetical protein
MIYVSGSLVKFVDKLEEMGYIPNATQRQAYAGERRGSSKSDWGLWGMSEFGGLTGDPSLRPLF